MTRVRGMKVRVLECRGLGSETDDRYERFACRAGTRAPGERFDTVAVLYKLRVRDSTHALYDVSFIGGTGIP